MLLERGYIVTRSLKLCDFDFSVVRTFYPSKRNTTKTVINCSEPQFSLVYNENEGKNFSGLGDRTPWGGMLEALSS